MPAWSTREIAELAGTSLRAVRHYHDVGLLAEPERRSNGYKNYGVDHLLRLVRIKRLADLGFSLPQIAAMDDSDDHPEEALRDLDADLTRSIENLEQARAEVRTLIERAAPVDLPVGFIPPETAERLSEADRALMVVVSRVLGPRGLRAYGDLLRDAPVGPIEAAFDDLPADADEATRQALAERMAPRIREMRAAHPELGESRTDAPRGARFADRAIADAMVDLYSPAQLDVLRRAREIVAAGTQPSTSGSDNGAMR
jgi:DNA-binding transcriptional MerR regulator